MSTPPSTTTFLRDGQAVAVERARAGRARDQRIVDDGDERRRDRVPSRPTGSSTCARWRRPRSTPKSAPQERAARLGIEHDRQLAGVDLLARRAWRPCGAPPRGRPPRRSRARRGSDRRSTSSRCASCRRRRRRSARRRATGRCRDSRRRSRRVVANAVAPTTRDVGRALGVGDLAARSARAAASPRLQRSSASAASTSASARSS